MTEWLVRRFIQDPENTEDEKVRLQYGSLASYTGIACNVLLFCIKFIIGLVMHSISITSDAFNNLSDCLSNIITLFGYKLAAKPADKEHPFGHGRMEYVVSFVVSVIIFVVGFELLRESISLILHPSAVSFSWPLFVILVLSILVKFWMASFYTALGKKTDSLALIASGEDSRNDVLSTGVALGGLLLGGFVPSFPFDGVAGLAVSCFILKGGYGIAEEIISRLLGTPASYALTKGIENQILSHPEIIGVHDMIIHDYGPGKKIGSAHAEVDASMNFMAAHDVVDEAEREVYEKLHVMLTLHMDPVDRRNPQVQAYQEEVQNALKHISPDLSMHDFRVVPGNTHTNLVFDVLVPYSFSLSNEEIKKKIDTALDNHEPKLYTVITFDHAFVDQEEEEGNHE